MTWFITSVILFGTSFSVTVLWMMFLMMLSVILLSMLMILLSTLDVIRHLISGNNCNYLLNYESDLWDTVGWQKMACWFKCWKSSASFVWLVNNTGAIDMKMCGSVLVEKSSFKMLGLTFSSKLDWDSYIIFIAKTASKKIGALICSIKFLSPEGALYLYKSMWPNPCKSIWPCVEYCSHVRAGAPICYMELLDRLQNLFLLLLSPLHPWFIVEM